MVEKDLYGLLGVSPTAPPEKIRSAYRRLVRRYHPDLYTGDPEVANVNFRELTEAYEVLIDPRRRREYDRTLWSTNRPSPRRAASPSRAPDTPTHQVRWAHYPPPRPYWETPEGLHRSTRSTVRRAWDSASHRELFRTSRLGRDPEEARERSRGSFPRLERAWGKAKRSRLFRRDFARRTKLFVFLGLVLFVAILVGLATFPVAQGFNFLEQPPATGTSACLSSAHEQFLRGDQVAFSWYSLPVNHPSTTDLPQVTLVSGLSGPVQGWTAWNGSATFVADGGSYSFQTFYCAWPGLQVQFSGTYTGPLV